MSQENVEVVRGAFEVLTRLMAASAADPNRSMRDDYARFAEFLDPEFELVQATSAVEPGTLRGYQGFVTFIEGGREMWRAAQLEPQEFIAAGDQVVVLGVFRAQGRASGAEVEQPTGTVWTLRDGKVARVQAFLDPSEALEAAGLQA
jgi:uncharacterized protein